MAEKLPPQPGSGAAGESPSLAQRLAFLGMTAEDRERLRRIAPRLSECSDDFVQHFYEHLFKFEETSRFLTDPLLVERLKQMQKSHLASMLADPVDERYVARRSRVGDSHANVGISPQMFLGAYNQYLQYGLRQLASDGPGELGPFAEDVLSLLKAIFLDIELTLDAYFAQATRNLRTALDLLFHANNELRQFAQLASHDLKTPLATVANLCDETLDEFADQMPEEACKLIEMAKQRTYRMSDMISELLELSVPMSDDHSEGPVDFNQVVAECVERLSPHINRGRVSVQIAPDLPVVWGNRVRVREAVVNVLQNAVKFSDKSPAIVEVTAATAGDVCTLKISDNGPGIPAEHLEHIFSAFRRLKLHQDRPGTGLGLYFVRNLIAQDGGRVWAESELGRGSTFFIQLPRHGHRLASSFTN